jgi:hypothetical protein
VSLTTPAAVSFPGCRGKQTLELREADWLHQMMIDADIGRATAIFFLPVAGDRDDRGVSTRLRSAELLGDFIAVDTRQAEIEQDNVRSERLGSPERAVAFMSYFDGILPRAQQPG